MKAHSSPELDSGPASVHKGLADMFAPSMLTILESALESGTVSQSWSATILKCIPQSITAQTVAEHRPLALQNANVKWLTIIILLSAIDLF